MNIKNRKADRLPKEFYGSSDFPMEVFYFSPLDGDSFLIPPPLMGGD